jgi:glycosyltransferase involved in cell wall biosynthesis
MKICFWGDIGKALKGRPGGGGELQIALITRVLARSGHEVVVLDHETKEAFQTEEGIKVYPIEGWDKGIRVIRTFTHRLPSLYFSLRDQKADIYYCRISDFRHIFAWWAARKVKAKFILGIASDLEIMSFRMRWKYYYLTNMRSLWVFFNGIFIEFIYPLLLRKSDFILVQHEGQRDLLLEKGIKSILFPNLIDLTKLPVLSNPARNYFIYVGWLDKRKGFTEFFEIVNKMPDHFFKVIGPPRDKTGLKYYEKLKTFPNVTLLGKLNHADTLHYIANAKALISTSYMEGFPNIFIEAWACGVPVLSLNVDPGSVIEKQGLGKVTHGDLDKLLNAMNDSIFNKDFAERSKDYVANVHALNASKIREVGRLFSELGKKGTINQP